MDIAALPIESGFTVDQWADSINEHGILFWDSKKGEKPFYTEPNPDIKMYDVNEEHLMLELKEILGETKPVSEAAEGQGIIEDSLLEELLRILF